MTTNPPTTNDPRKAAQLRRRAVRRAVKRIGFSVLGLGVVAAIVIAWMPRPIPAELGVVSRGPLRVTVDEDGQARVKDRYVVSAPLAGSLGRIEREPGDSVRQGDVLASIAPASPALLDVRARTTANARLAQALAGQRQARVQIEHAQATFDFGLAEAKRQRQLFDRGAGARQALEQAELGERRATHELDAQKFAARMADYEVEMARAAVARMPGERSGGTQLDVPSPISGRVLKVLHKSEGVVQPGTPLVEVGDPGALEIAVDVLTSDAARIRPGAPTTIDRWGGATLEGRVRRIEPSAFTRMSALGVEEQRVNLLIDLTSPRDQWATLGDGYRVEAHVVVWDAADVLKVPTSALFRQDGGWALFRLDGRVARLTPVEIGQRTAHEAEILRGVSAGQRIVAHPSDRIRDGVRVSAP
ncbi:MAG: efflux RND transporter periplasmic adaptor subunit [Polyangia bacterium]